MSRIAKESNALSIEEARLATRVSEVMKKTSKLSKISDEEKLQMLKEIGQKQVEVSNKRVELVNRELAAFDKENAAQLKNASNRAVS